MSELQREDIINTSIATSDITCSTNSTVISDGPPVNGHWAGKDEEVTMQPNEQKTSAFPKHQPSSQSQTVEDNKRPLFNGVDLGRDGEEADDSDALFPVQYPDIDVLIMSEAGKPIYCYSDREDHTTLMGVCVALLNFVLKTQNDNLRSIHTRTGLHINFAHRSPLVIVVVCRQHSCFDEQTLINQIHAQIITTTTLQMLKSIFQKAPTYDMKRGINSKFSCFLFTYFIFILFFSQRISENEHFSGINFFTNSRLVYYLL